MFIAFFTYKLSHQERHYLVNPSGRKESTTCEYRDQVKARNMAFRFKTTEEAMDSMDKKLKAWNYGLDNGYYYQAWVEEI